MQAFLKLLFISLAPYVELEFEIPKGFNFNNHQRNWWIIKKTKNRTLKGFNISIIKLFNPLRG
jgi:hypothetical protein